MSSTQDPTDTLFDQQFGGELPGVSQYIQPQSEPAAPTMDPKAKGELLKTLGALIATTAQGGKSQKAPKTDPVAEGAATPSPDDLTGNSQVSQALLAQGTNQAMDAGNQANAAADKAESTGLAAAKAEEAQSSAVARGQADLADHEMAQLDSLDSAFTASMKEAQQEKKTGLDRYLTAVEDLKNTHVYNWWSQAGTGATILGIISQALAGAFQGLTGQSGPTPLDHVIDQEIVYQRMNLAQKSDVSQQTGGLYRDLSAQLKDRVQVESALREIAYNSTIERMKAFAASLGEGQAKVNYLKNVSALQERAAIIRQQNFQYIGKMAQEGSQSRAGFMTKYAEVWGTLAGHTLAAGAAANQKPLAGIQNVQNFEYFDRGHPEAAEKLRQQIGGAENVKSLARDLQGLLVQEVAGPDGKPMQQFADEKALSGEQKNAIDQKLAEAILAYKNLFQLGAISEGDKDLAEAAIGVKNGLASRVMRKLGIDSVQAMWKRLQTDITDTDRAMAKTIGRLTVQGPDGKMVKLQYTPDPF
jgi:hypothetical protein